MATEIPNIGFATPDFAIEFRAKDDDAWYEVKLFFDGDSLTVKYINFSDECNEIYHIGSFKTIKEVEDFKSRFRPGSVQLQDHECRKIVKGNVVCASYFFNNDEIKFYDAIVDDVMKREHSFAKGEEECFCTFVLFWQHGPLQGTKTFANIATICLTPSTRRIDPALSSFLKITREKIVIAMKNSNLSEAVGKDSSPEESHASSLVYKVREDYSSPEEPDDSTLVYKVCEDSSPEESDTFNLISTSNINVEAFFMKLRKRRRFRCATRTSEGRLNGRCKKIEQATNLGAATATAIDNHSKMFKRDHNSTSIQAKKYFML